jgi:hypothetical protein
MKRRFRRQERALAGRRAAAAARGLACAVLLASALGAARADISLSPGPAFEIGSVPEVIATADFDRDGLPDVASLEPGSSAIVILFGDQTRTLGRIGVVGVTARLDTFAVGDANGDGFADLISLTNTTDSVYISSGNGAGSFLLPSRVDVGRRPVDVALGNFDGARGNDLVVAAQDDDDIYILLNRGGSAGFLSERPLIVGNRPKRVGTGDLNGDGLDDIVVLNTGLPNDDDVSVLLNPGNGVFNRQVRYGVGPRSKDLAVVDTNQDGAPDIVVLNGKTVVGRSNAFTVSVLLNRTEMRDDKRVGTGAFDAAQDVEASCPATIGGVPVFCDPRRLAVADFDGDGFIDIAVSFTTLAKVGVLFTPGVVTALAGYGDGSFGQTEQANVGARPAGIAPADFNGDHVSDLAVAEQGTSSIRIVLGLPPAQRAIGESCTSGVQCASGFCTDTVCCLTASCPADELCNYAGVEGTCSREPAPTATPTETPPPPTATALATGAPCEAGTPPACAAELFCTDGRCCASAACAAGERCDLPGSAGQCAPLHAEGGVCEQESDCAAGLHCEADGDAGRVCVAPAPPTPTTTTPPTETPSPMATRTGGGVCTGNCPCAGDCDNDSRVTVDEILALVAIGLDRAEVSGCRAGDSSGDGRITVDEIVAAAHNAVSGCSPPP